MLLNCCFNLSKKYRFIYLFILLGMFRRSALTLFVLSFVAPGNIDEMRTELSGDRPMNLADFFVKYNFVEFFNHHSCGAGKQSNGRYKLVRCMFENYSDLV